MLTPDVRWDGFDAADWIRLIECARRPDDSRPGERIAGGVVAVHAHGRLRKLLHTVRGTLPMQSMRWPVPLSQLAAQAGASWVISLEGGALEELIDRASARMRRQDDLLAQLLEIWSAAREVARKGRLSSWPLAVDTAPVPSVLVVRKALGMLFPPHHVAVLAAFEGGQWWTGAAVRWGSTGIDWVRGPDELGERDAMLRGGIALQHAALVAEARRCMGPIALGVSASPQTWRSLVWGAGPGLWARAMAEGHLVVAPMPASVAVPIAVDAGRLVLAAFRVLLQRTRAQQGVGSTHMAEAAGSANAVWMLDLDLWNLLWSVAARWWTRRSGHEGPVAPSTVGSERAE